jgi:hypothetical protein
MKGTGVKTQSPLARLMQTRMQQLGLDAQMLGFRLGYQNAAKAAGRVQALCDGHLANPKSRAALARLPEALELPTEVVRQARIASEELFVEQKRQAEVERRLEREAEESEWRRGFTPHAIIQTERTVPSQIMICGLTGGVGRWLMIRLDDSKPPITFVRQVLAVIPAKVRLGSDGRQYVIFFGEAFGFIINYSPVKALRCNLSGEPLEFLPRAYRPGEVMLSIGGRRISPTTAAALLGLA